MLTPTNPPGSANALICRVGNGEELEIDPRIGDRGNQPMAEVVQVVVDLGIVHDRAGIRAIC